MMNPGEPNTENVTSKQFQKVIHTLQSKENNKNAGNIGIKTAQKEKCTQQIDQVQTQIQSIVERNTMAEETITQLRSMKNEVISKYKLNSGNMEEEPLPEN